MTDPNTATVERFSRNTLVMSVGTLLSRLTGFGKVFALAYAFGFTRLADTYQIANTTPNIVFELVLGGVLSGTFIPLFVNRLANKDEDEAWEAISAVVTLSLVVMVGATILFAALSPWIISLYTVGVTGKTAADQHAVATVLLILFAPQLAFYGVITVSTAILNARYRFATPAFAPVLNNLVVIAVLLSMRKVTTNLALAAVRHDTGALLLLGLGTTAGVAVQAVAQVWAMRGIGARLRLLWAPRHEAVRTELRLSGWTVGFVVANQVALYVALVLANHRSGDVAAWTAAQTFFFVPYGIFAVSVTSALLPDLAANWSTGKVAAFRRDVALGLRLVAFVLVPAALGYIVLARPIIELVLRHGQLTEHSARVTADVLALFAAGLPGFSAYLLLVRAYQAMLDTRSLFFLYLVENGINVVLAFAFYPRWGVQGLAAAFSVAYTAATFITLAHLRRRTQGLEGRSMITSLVRISAASLVMTAAVIAVSRLIGEGGQLHLLLQVGAGVAAGVTVYAVAAKVLRVGELSVLFRPRSGAT
jgi:putative peptidoglycan lipid II flippase